MAGRRSLKNNPFAEATERGIQVPCQVKISLRNGGATVVCLTHPTFQVPLHDLGEAEAPAEIARMHRERPDVFR